MYVCELQSSPVVYVCMHVCFDLYSTLSHTYFAVASICIKMYATAYLCKCYRVYVCVQPGCIVVYVCMHVRVNACILRCHVCVLGEIFESVMVLP
jgi:hypothetical protein